MEESCDSRQPVETQLRRDRRKTDFVYVSQFQKGSRDTVETHRQLNGMLYENIACFSSFMEQMKWNFSNKYLPTENKCDGN